MEKRSRKRLNLELPTLISGFDIRNNPFMEYTKTLNISSGGTFFLIQNQVGKESSLRAIITLPRKINNQLDITGKVLRVENMPDNNNQNNGIALQFESLISV